MSIVKILQVYRDNPVRNLDFYSSGFASCMNNTETSDLLNLTTAGQTTMRVAEYAGVYGCSKQSQPDTFLMTVRGFQFIHSFTKVY